jgi:hypothetical protein
MKAIIEWKVIAGWLAGAAIVAIELYIIGLIASFVENIL